MSKARGRRPRNKKASPRPLNLPAEEVEVTRIAAQGDGEATLGNGKRIYLPLTLPGEKVVARPTYPRGEGVAGEVKQRISGPPQAEPFCEHFGTCGGCRLQHVPMELYRAWKQEKVETAFRRQNIVTRFNPLMQVPIDSRRRVTFGAVQTERGINLGFKGAYSDRIVSIDDCPVLVPEVRRLILPLATLLGPLMPAGLRADVAVTWVDTKTDILIKGDLELDLDAREAVAQFADKMDIARISLSVDDEAAPEPLIIRSEISVVFGGHAVPFFPGCFLQPSEAGERALQDIVLKELSGMRFVADLFCGLGTFAVPLAAAGCRVHAVDSERRQIEALSHMPQSSDLQPRLQADIRNLFTSPLTSEELSSFDAVVFDPPRAGAKAQSAALANSDVQTVIAVSCNPSTMARDVRLLEDGGYGTQWVTPLDQFPMTPHVEAIALLTR